MQISSHRNRWSRRRFVQTCAASAIAAVTPRALSLGADAQSDIRITRVVAFDLRCARNKVAGKNARLDVHGDSAVDPMVRLYTNAKGVEGIGICRAKKEKLAELLGRDPLAFLDAEAHRMRSPLGSQTMALWDLVARMRDKPVCELLGAPPVTGPRKVPVYDGSIYFADLTPQYGDAGEDRFKPEIDMGL